MINFGKKVQITAAYILMVVIINAIFVWVPDIPLFSSQFNLGDCVVGMVYIVRDYAQREIGHRVVYAMIVAAGLSYVLADHSVAMASLAAFTVGETIEWALFTYTKKPFAERLLWSSLISVPVDSMVFLGMIGRLNPLELTVLTLGKIVGVLTLFLICQRRRLRIAPISI